MPMLKKNTQALKVISKETGVEVNTVETKYIFVSHKQNAVQNHNIKVNL